MNGPFDHGIDYIGEIHVDFTPSNNKYEIEITEYDLNRYKFLRFIMRQDLHFFHGDSVFVYLQTSKGSQMLFVKPTPTQVYEFLEYRVRLTTEMCSGTSGAKLIFMYHGPSGAEMDIAGLQFGPLEDGDEVVLPTGISIAIIGGGISSPLPGYNPVAVGEVVNVKLYPYLGAKLKKVSFYGSVYDENGVLYPPFIYESDFNVRYTTPFENVQIIAQFGSI